MFERFKFWKKSKPEEKPEISPDQVVTDDQVMREAVARAFNTGNIIIGNRDDDGNVKFEELEKGDE